MVHILATFNNIIVTISDPQGGVLVTTSAGAHGFKGSKKSTPYAAQVTAEHAAKIAVDLGMKTVSVLVCGPGSGRESAIRAIKSSGLGIIFIRDNTPIPHNGCRLKGKRRV